MQSTGDESDPRREPRSDPPGDAAGRAERDEAGPGGHGDDPRRDLRGVLHDVANALTVVLGWVEHAADAGADLAARDYALGVVRERARLAQELARQVLVRGEVADETARLDGVLDEVVRALGPAAARRSASLGREGGAGHTGALVRDARALARVVTNLVLNALAHVPEGGHVVVRAEVDEDGIDVVVLDDGPGVPASLVSSIFEGTSTRAGGAGVGLAHSRAVARSVGGDVVLERGAGARVGAAAAPAGARFVVSWPRADAIPRAPSSRLLLDDLAGLDVLVLEDDAAVVQLLVLALETRGASVRTARSRAELEAALAEPGARFDAALVDLSPLGSDAGGELLALEARLPRTRFVVVTGSVDALPAALDPVRTRVVKKPFEAREVVAALSSLVHATEADTKEA